MPSLWTGMRVTLLWYKPCCFSNANYFVIMLTRYWSLSQGPRSTHLVSLQIKGLATKYITVNGLLQQCIYWNPGCTPYTPPAIKKINLIDRTHLAYAFTETDWTWKEERQKPSCELLPQEWWSYFVKVLEGYLDAHWESWSCASRSFCGYISSSWGRMIRIRLKLLSMIIWKVRPASSRYVTESFSSKLNFSNISSPNS